MNKTLIKRKIISYIEIAYQWHSVATYELRINNQWHQMIDLEIEIIKSFGLPFMAQKYSDILQTEGFSINNLEQKSERLFNKLVKEAEIFLLSPIESDIHVLKQAKKSLKWSLDILPIIGFPTTPYNNFIYYEYYFRAKITAEQFLDILKSSLLLDKSPETRIPHNYETLKSNQNFETKINTELLYLKEFKAFLKYAHAIQFWNYQSANLSFSEYVEKVPLEEMNFDAQKLHNLIDLDLILPHEFKLPHFFIKQIQIKKQTTYKIIILTKRKETGWVEIELPCSHSTLFEILRHARYNITGITMINLINNEILAYGDESIFECKKIINMEIEIINIDMSIKLIKKQWEITEPDYPF